MPWAASCYFLPDPAIRRRCARCSCVLRVTPEDELMCPRCGHARVWMVNLSDLGSIVGDVDPGFARESAGSCSGRKAAPMGDE
jgi:hypothetical protein